MKALVVFGIIVDIFFMLVMIDLLVHDKDNKRRAHIRRIKKARQKMEDEYGGYDSVEPKKAKHEAPRQSREEQDKDLKEWLEDLTMNERDLHDFYAGNTETINVPLPAQEVIS